LELNASCFGFIIVRLFVGGEIVSTFDHPDQVRLGKCDLIEEIMIGEDKVSELEQETISIFLS
jgi:hypothetical protein